MLRRRRPFIGRRQARRGPPAGVPHHALARVTRRAQARGGQRLWHREQEGVARRAHGPRRGPGAFGRSRGGRERRGGLRAPSQPTRSHRLAVPEGGHGRGRVRQVREDRRAGRSDPALEQRVGLRGATRRARAHGGQGRRRGPNLRRAPRPRVRGTGAPSRRVAPEAVR